MVVPGPARIDAAVARCLQTWRVYGIQSSSPLNACWELVAASHGLETGLPSGRAHEFKSVQLIFYRAMHFSAKRGLAIACRPSVRPSANL